MLSNEEETADHSADYAFCVVNQRKRHVGWITLADLTPTAPPPVVVPAEESSTPAE